MHLLNIAAHVKEECFGLAKKRTAYLPGTVMSGDRSPSLFPKLTPEEEDKEEGTLQAPETEAEQTSWV